MQNEERQNGAAQPAQQAKAGVSPRSGTAPPAEFRWPPGQSGNVQGRPSAGATIEEWYNTLQHATLAELKELVEDGDTPAAKAAAARAWIDARSMQRSKSGYPIAGPEVDRIADRTQGKPTQTVAISQTETSTAGELVKALGLAKLKELALAMLNPSEIEESREMIDVEVTPTPAQLPEK
jgi:hypothetical protein